MSDVETIVALLDREEIDEVTVDDQLDLVGGRPLRLRGQTLNESAQRVTRVKDRSLSRRSTQVEVRNHVNTTIHPKSRHRRAAPPLSPNARQSNRRMRQTPCDFDGCYCVMTTHLPPMCRTVISGFLIAK